MSDRSDDLIAAVGGEIAVLILERTGQDQAVQPQLTEVMRRAFQKAKDVLQLHGRPDDMTDVIATKIIELAKAGEIDPDRLCSQVLIELADRLSDAER